MGPDGLPQMKSSAISISRVRTVHVQAVCSVREQPDTGYRKSLLASFAAALTVIITG